MFIAITGVLLLLWFPSIPVANSNIDMQLWYDFGMFYNYAKELHWLQDYRQVSRLPAVLPGFVLTNIFDGVTVAYILFFGYYLTTLGFFYHAVRRLITEKVALFATAFLATSAFIVGNFSTTLSEVPGISFNAVSLYLVAYAITGLRRERTYLALFGSGLFAGLAIHSHLVFIPYVCANYVIYVLWELFSTGKFRERCLRALIGSLLALAGILLITAVLGAIIVVAFRGSFLQLFNDFVYIPAAEKSLDRSATIGWFWNGAELGILIAACLNSLINIVMVRRHKSTNDPKLESRLIAVSVAVLALSAVLLAHSALGGPFVAYSSYFVCFLPYLGLLLFPPLVLGEFSGARLLPYVLTFYVFSLAAISVREYWAPWLYKNPTQAIASVACAIILAILYALQSIDSLRIARRSLAAIYLVFVLVMAFVARPEEELGSLLIWKQTRQEASLQRGLYVRIDQGLRFLNGLALTDYPKFWVDEAATPETAIYPRAYMQHKNQVFPNIDAYLWRSWYFCRFVPGDDVIVIGSPRDLATRAETAFSSLHLRAVQIASQTIAHESMRYEILVEHITNRVDHKLPPATTLPDAFFPPVGPSVQQGQAGPPLTLTLPRQAWAYGAVFQFKDDALAGPLSVRLSVRVANAPIAIGVLNAQQTDFLNRVIVGPSMRDMSVTLHIADGAEPGGLVFETAAGATKSPVVQVKSIVVSNAY